jgi:hypothetical protein
MLSTFSRPPCAAGGILVNPMVGALLLCRAWQPLNTMQKISVRSRSQLELIDFPNLIEHHD